MYWRRKLAHGKRDQGRWHGPAKVIVQEGNKVVWLADGSNLIRCSPEQLRAASFKEQADNASIPEAFLPQGTERGDRGAEPRVSVPSEGPGPTIYVDNIQASGVPPPEQEPAPQEQPEDEAPPDGPDISQPVQGGPEQPAYDFPILDMDSPIPEMDADMD